MNREEKFVITISRQFGTGGHEIGAELARRLNVKLLDKQILNEVAKRNRVVEEAMEKIEARNPLWRDDFTNFYQNYMSKAEYDGTEHDQTSLMLRQKPFGRLLPRSRVSSLVVVVSTSLQTIRMR